MAPEGTLSSGRHQPVEHATPDGKLVVRCGDHWCDVWQYSRAYGWEYHGPHTLEQTRQIVEGEGQ